MRDLLKIGALSLATAAFSIGALSAHDIITTNLTYTRDISRILQSRCISCHGPRDSIPLTTYNEVRPWAVAIKEQVLSRSMPPWGAVKGFGDLQPDLALGQEEIMTIAAWVLGGAPEGGASVLPAPFARSKAHAARPVKDDLTVDTRVTLSREMQLIGIRPLSTDRKIISAQLIAKLPNGRIVPLVWLYDFESKSAVAFLFREPLALPTGTVVESSTPLRYALQIPAAIAPSRTQ